MGRLLFHAREPYQASDFVEEPLRQWVDIAGSKVAPQDFLVSATELIKVTWRMRR